MDSATLHGRETAGTAIAHGGVLSGSTRNAIRLHWWHRGRSDRLPHPSLSVQIDFAYIGRDILLGFLSNRLLNVAT